MATTIHDFLLDRLNIHVTGPSFPGRDAPLQSYIPTHRSHRRQAPSAPLPSSPSATEGMAQHHQARQQLIERSLFPGGSARSIPSAHAKDGFAVVYDRGVSTKWCMEKTIQAYEVFF